MTRVLVTGSRGWTDTAAVEDYLRGLPRPLVVVHGDCPTGVDAIAKAWATRTIGVIQEPYPADWDTHGRAAGPIRNQVMVDQGDYDLCVAWPSGPSRGTRDCMTRAARAGIPVVDRGSGP